MKIKKILMGVFALTLSVVGLVAGTHTVNAESTTLKMTDSGWWWQRIQPDDGNYHSWHLTWYEFNGRIAYCIQPGIPEGDTYQTENLDSYNISNKQKERIMLIAYYGYDYTGHQTTEYIAATQALLWETMNAYQTVFSSKRCAQGTIYDISDQRNEIERLVRNHYVRPSFNGTTINAKVGEEVILTDTNNVLSNYYVSASNGAEVRIDGNKLIVKTTKVGKVTLQFKKRLYTDREYLVYYSSGKQTMMSSGVVDPALSVVNIESLGGKVEFTKYDRDNNSTIPSGEATLEGAVYGIYNAETDALVSKVTTGKDGKGKLEHLPAFAKYYLKEILTSKGYELDNNKYYFESTLENIDNEIADNVYNGALPVHVHFLMDEFTNVSLPDDFENILSTMRSRNVSVSIILQNLAQLKALFEKQWGSIVGNCDEFLYLGCKEQETFKYVSELLGKETIDTNTYGKTSGLKGNYSTNYQNAGRELLMPDEVRVINNKQCVLFIRCERPIIDLKFDIKKHPNINFTPDGNGKNYYHGTTNESIGEVSISLIDENTEFNEIEKIKNKYEVIYSEEIDDFLERKGKYERKRKATKQTKKD